MLNTLAFLLGGGDLYLFPPRKLGMDVFNNLDIFALCRARINPDPPDYCVSLRLLSIASQSTESILVKEVSCTLQRSFDGAVP